MLPAICQLYPEFSFDALVVEPVCHHYQHMGSIVLQGFINLWGANSSSTMYSPCSALALVLADGLPCIRCGRMGLADDATCNVGGCKEGWTGEAKRTSELYDADAVCKEQAFCVTPKRECCAASMPVSKILELWDTVGCLWDFMTNTSFITTVWFLASVCNVLLSADIWKVSSMITGDSSVSPQELFPQKHSSLHCHTYLYPSHVFLCVGIGVSAFYQLHSFHLTFWHFKQLAVIPE